MLHRESGALVTRRLPTLKLYKIGVKLDMTGNTAADAKAEVLEHEKPERREHMEAPELSDLEVATIRVVQEDLPLVEHPFAAYGEMIGCDEDTVLELLALVQGAQAHAALRRGDEPPLRRLQGQRDGRVGGARRRARRDRAADGGLRAGEPLLPPADLRRLAVLDLHHGARQERAATAKTTIAAIHAETGVDEYALLWSVKEYKKTRVRYFTDDWDDWRAASTSRRPPDRSVIDVARARADTPGCGDVVHLNNAGAALPPRTVVDTVIDHLELEARVGGYCRGRWSPNGPARSTRRWRRSWAQRPTRSRSSRTRHARGTWSSTRWRRRSCRATGSSRRAAEYASNVIGFAAAVTSHRSIAWRSCPTTTTGQFSVDALEAMLDDRVRLVAMSWIPTQGGLVNPAAEVGAVTRARKSRTCSTPARPPASSRSTSTRSAATSSPPPAASTCARRAAPGCSTCVARGSSGSSRRSSTCTPRTGRRVTTS